LKPGAPRSGDFPELPELEPIHVTLSKPEVFSDTKFPNKDGSPRVRLQIVMTPVAEEYEDARIWAFVTPSFHEKAGNGTVGLRQIVEAVRGKRFTEDNIEDLYEFDTDDLEGAELMVLGQYKGEDRSYLRPTAYKPVKKAGAKATTKAAPAPKPEPTAAAAAAGDGEDIDDF
jgi:hypothetical protein